MPGLQHRRCGRFLATHRQNQPQLQRGDRHGRIKFMVPVRAIVHGGALHEPAFEPGISMSTGWSKSPPGFGLRQSSGALAVRRSRTEMARVEPLVAPPVGKRQRAAAVQNAGAATASPCQFIVPMRNRMVMRASHELAFPSW